jgi:hypothetical protein
MLERDIPAPHQHMPTKNRTSANWDLWGARDDAVPFSGSADEVALIARETGKSAIQVRLAIMKVGNDKKAILAELKERTRNR